MLPEIRTILYCTQLGPNASHVFRYAWELARRLGAKIVVLHVIETLTSRQKALVEGYSGKGSLSKLLRKAESEAVERIPRRIREFVELEIGRADEPSPVSDIIVAEGKAAARILEHIEAVGADLVVVGARSDGSVLEHLIGSTARSVIHRSPVPVLTVPVPEGRTEHTIDS